MRSERGAALLLAVVALAAMGAMVAGAFFAGWLELRSSAAGRDAVVAFEAAENGLAQASAAWRPALNRLPIGRDTVLSADSSARTGYAAIISRLSESLFFVRSAGWRPGPDGAHLAERLVGAFIRPVPLDIDHASALTLLGSADLASADIVDGGDPVPAGWDGFCAASAAVPPIRSAGAPVAVDAGPAAVVTVDPSVTAATFTGFGRATFDQLALMADHQISGLQPPLGPSAVAGQCAHDVASNWGEPDVGPGSVPECAGFLPLVYAPGNLALSGGRGQGILLVRGDLDLSGGVVLDGVVVVLGRLTTSGAGGQVIGTLLVAGSTGTTRLGPGTTVAYSACVVGRALAANGVRAARTPRGWAQLY
jgi:hypothetical protein